ncbi:hypothetical protein FSARC_4549 [Fusarium sarcochroum]|uniref:Uncharacterized protein n=1 Tax=Fusarium sarcochroum TaxID=1208366 RepID=A0A8H4U1W7_9HYPO|nr:hypothetical protein FSARC_4549 [Fusarium sarcochroum]
MTTPCDTSPEVVPSDLPQAIYPNAEQDNWSRQEYHGYTSPTGDAAYRNDSQYYQQSSSPLPTKAEAETQIQATPASDTGIKPKRRCSCLVIALIIALIVSCAAVIALAAVTGVTIKQKQDSESEIKALHASLSASSITISTATSASPSATQDDADDLSNGCSAKEEEISDTTYTSECKNPITVNQSPTVDLTENNSQALPQVHHVL